MPLSEEELRLLEQMERALVAEDPKFASALRGTARRRDARRRSFIAGGVFVLGVVVLMTGAVLQNIVVGVTGFVVMLVSAVVALNYWRSQSSSSAPRVAGPAHPEGAPGLTVMPGGKKSRKKRAPRSRQSNSGQSMMQRFEERWRRRRDSNGL